MTLLLLSPFNQAVVYKWQDKEGITHYSNQPYDGASELSLLPIEEFNIPVVLENKALNQSVPNRSENKKSRRYREEAKQQKKRVKNWIRDK